MTKRTDLGAIIRDAREIDGLFLRELARRSGVSAGQLSRIESGEVSKPALQTIWGLAQALGRPQIALSYVAGHSSAEELLSASWELVDMSPELRKTWPDSVLDKLQSAAPDDRRAKGELEKFARDLFLSTNLGDAVESLSLVSAADGSVEDITAIAAAWPGISPARRELIRLFVSDQQLLSELERRPSSKHPFDIQVTITPRKDGKR